VKDERLVDQPGENYSNRF